MMLLATDPALVFGTVHSFVVRCCIITRDYVVRRPVPAAGTHGDRCIHCGLVLCSREHLKQELLHAASC
jgi:hypothetical protein